MDWTQALLDVIDFGSFSTVWYWMAVAVVWSTATHWILGVPFDMIQRARRQGGAAIADVEALAHVHARRILLIAREAGAWLAGVLAFMLSALAVLAFWYWVEFAQAVFLIAAPMAIVGILSHRAARSVEAGGLAGEALCRMLIRQRLWHQGVGMVAIFTTAVFGMYENLASIQGF